GFHRGARSALSPIRQKQASRGLRRSLFLPWVDPKFYVLIPPGQLGCQRRATLHQIPAAATAKKAQEDCLCVGGTIGFRIGCVDLVADEQDTSNAADPNTRLSSGP